MKIRFMDKGQSRSEERDVKLLYLEHPRDGSSVIEAHDLGSRIIVKIQPVIIEREEA